jgi:purine-nucleoside/S-methyl-5'-thioadenosine phosphorylase / adenosine deaminase
MQQMLERHTSPTGVVTYVSSLLREANVRHAFSTRIGGLSPAPFDSLNLGNPNGCDIQDPTERVRANYALLQQAAGCAGVERVYLHQVHGAVAWTLRPGSAHNNDAKGDVLVSNDPSRVLSMRVADCVPVLLASRNGKTVAAIHAGWRGVVAGAAIVGLEKLCELQGIRTREVIAAIGPSIGFEAFEVGPEVLEAFARVFGSSAPVRRRDDGKGHVDLREAIRGQLLAANIPQSQIDATDRCTYTHVDEFFSHRRENGVTGRMAAIIASNA